MEHAVRTFVAIHFLVIGLSHITQHRAWAEFFVALRERGSIGSFVNGFLSLGVGSVIVAFHGAGSGWPGLLTLLGWGMVLKGAVCLVFPEVGLASLRRVSLERSRVFVFVGAVMVCVGGALAWSVVAA